MKYFSMFSGIGGFELGIKQIYEGLCIKNKKQKKERIRDSQRQNSELNNRCANRFTCIGYSEIDKYAIQIYEKHFKHKNYGDATKIDTRELPDFDLLIGGFPCQSFSIAGKRGGFKDTRGTLFFEIARIVKVKRPTLLLLENVKGLLNHDKGNTFATIISTLDELGYDCQWCVLNSKNFGVPQNRERVFIIGHLRGTSRPKVFPIGETTGVSARKNEQWDGKLAATLRAGGNLERKVQLIINPKLRNYRESKIAGALTESQYKEPQVVNTIRRLTPTECERLQGFPDGWTEGVSDTQRYKCLGNAVTVNVVKAIMEELIIKN